MGLHYKNCPHCNGRIDRKSKITDKMREDMINLRALDVSYRAIARWILENHKVQISYMAVKDVTDGIY